MRQPLPHDNETTMGEDNDMKETSTSILRSGAALAVAVALPVLAACEGDSAIGPDASGNYRVQLARTGDAASATVTDANLDDAGIRAARLSSDVVDAVELTLEAVEVYRLNSDTTGSDTTRGPDARWVRLDVIADSAGGDSTESDSTSDGSDPVVLDLTELPDDSTGITVAAGDLAAGTYRGLRLRFSGAEITLSDSASLGNSGQTYGPGTYDLFVPSGAQTGVKLPTVQFSLASEESETTTVLTDTDASIKNINLTGRGFLMTPVLMAASGDSTAADTVSDGS